MAIATDADTTPGASADMAQPRPIPDKELGITLDMPFGTYGAELPNPAESAVPDMLARIEAMLRTDGHFRALARLLSLPFRQAKWSMVPGDDDNGEAEFIEAMLTRPPYEGGMTTSFDYVRALGARAFWHGFQVWEEVYTYADIPGYDKPMLVLRKLAPRESSTIKFRADDHGGFDGVTQRASDRTGGMKTVLIPRDKVLFFTVDKEEHPFYGRSMFEPALYHFDKKHKLYYIAHIAAQISAVPGRVASQEAGGANKLSPSENTSLRRALADFGFNSAMVLPPGIKLDSFGQGTTSGVEGILSLINHHNIQASQSILAQFIDLGQQSGGGGGSFALSKDSSDLFLMCCQALLDSFGEMLTWHLFPKFIDWNFGTKCYPTLRFEPLADDTKAALMEVFSTIATAATSQTTPDFIFELERKVSDMLGLDIDYDAIEEERSLVAEQTDQVAEALDAILSDGLGVDPAAEPLPEPLVPLSDDADPATAVFLSGDYGPEDLGALVELAATTDKAEAARRRRLAEKGKRDKLGQFSRINEVGPTAANASPGGAIAAVVGDIQTRLASLGYDAGEKGYGPATAAQVAEFQRDNGMPATGRVDMGTYAMLLEQAPKGTAAIGAALEAKGAKTPKLGSTLKDQEDWTPEERAAYKAKKAAKKAPAKKKKSTSYATPARSAAEAARRLKGSDKPPSED